MEWIEKKIINKSMVLIIRLQVKMEKIDFKISSIKHQVLMNIILFGIFIISSFMVIGNFDIGRYIGIIVIIILLFLKATGWRKSVKKWLFLTVIVNGTLILIFISNIKLPVVAICLYFLLWIFFSLIAVSSVAKLVNEIIASISATFFSIGTFLLSINPIDLTQLERKYQYIEQNIDNISDTEMLDFTKVFLMYTGFELADIFFRMLLPIILVSAICVVLSSIKQYWMNKYEISEVGAKEENSCSWVINTIHRYQELSPLFISDNEFLIHRIKIKNTTKEIGSSYKAFVLKDFQEAKMNTFLDSLEINGEIEKPCSQDVDVRINVAKVIEQVDRLSIEYKVQYYGNLIRNAYMFSSKMKAEEFEEYYTLLINISISNLKLLCVLSKFCRFTTKKDFEWNYFNKYIESDISDELVEDFQNWIINERLIKCIYKADMVYQVTNRFINIEQNILLSYGEKAEGIDYQR